jgi:hypothetical protein
MRRVKYQEVSVTLSAATFSRLEQATPFNKSRVRDRAIEAISVALLTIYPPHTPEEWKDRSRFEGVARYQLLLSYDLICYSIRKWIGRNAEPEGYTIDGSELPVNLTLRIPTGLGKWIEQIAQSKRKTIPEATVYTIEYGLLVLDSQQPARV